eukprot:CAMPEP_0172172834 /NCGR_PEP_ID=MMETSP1050-20130122/12674_1 /TAXON_ID=233186 /ORGANISM="Cryptomonas curvata, Strain CCAP979/52" /LENGTH=71 /DNA_ID=CAMNT_0012844433 /DNA_START=219 /DNA_END=431 /DNA_ORIENTATION=+
MSGPPLRLQAGATSPCPGTDVRYREETRSVTNSSKSTGSAPGLAGPGPKTGNQADNPPGDTNSVCEPRIKG